MVRTQYTGIDDAKARFGRLRALREELIRMQDQVRPFGPDFLILEAVRKALDTAAYHFTREPDFYSHKPPGA